MNYKIALKKSVSHDLKKKDREQAQKILNKIASELPEKAGILPQLTGIFLLEKIWKKRSKSQGQREPFSVISACPV